MNSTHTHEIQALHAFIEESPAPLALYTGLEMHIAIANKAMRKAWGKDETVTGKPFSQALPELQTQSFHQLLDNAYTTGMPCELKDERVSLPVNGELQTFYYDLTCKPLKNPDGSVWGLINSLTDVTERVLARRQDAEEQAALEFALSSAQIGTWDLDPVTDTWRCDRRCRELYGMQAHAGGAGFSHGMLQYIHAHDAARVKLAIKQALDPHYGGNYDVKFRTAANTDCWLHCRGKAYFDDQGRPYRFSGTVQDISIQVQADEKVRSAEHIARLAAEGAGVGTFHIDLLTDRITYSPTLSTILTGTAKEDLTRRAFIEHLHPDDRLKRKKAYEEAAQSGNLLYEARFIWNDGSVHWLKTHGTYVFDENRKPVSFVGISQDISREVAAREEQQKLISLIENSADYMAVTNSSRQIIYINKAGRELLGFDRPQIPPNLYAEDFYSPEHFVKITEQVRPALQTRGKWSGTVYLQHFKTRENIPCHADFVSIRDPLNGELVATGATLRDLRPELASRQALIDSEQRFRNMIKMAPVAIGILRGADLIIETANTQLLALWDKNPNVIGIPLTDALPELRDQEFPGLLQEVYRTGRAYYGYETLAVIERGGKLENCYFNFVYSPARETDHTISGVMVVAIEVTPQVEAKKRLEQSEKRFRNLILEAPMATALYTGENMVIDLANDAMLKLWDKSPEVIGMELSSALPELEGQPFLELLQQVYTTGVAYHAEQQQANLVVNGRMQPFWFNFTYKPLHDEQGKVYAILNMAVDVSAQVLLQKQKDEFLGIASHELKTPVTSIKAYAQLLQSMLQKEGDSAEAGMVQKMNNQINRLTNLIGDLLDVTKINSGKLQFNDSHFDFNAMVAEVAEDLQHTSPRHKIMEELEETGMIYGDRERISQVITNLLTNAIKYSPHADRVIISASRSENTVTLAVRDFGIGIPDDKREKVFEQFYRVGGDKQHTFPGLGLGLYISAEIIKRGGGKIWAERPAGGTGTLFCFSLPVQLPQR